MPLRHGGREVPRPIREVATLALVALLAVGCGDDDDPAPSATAPKQEAVPAVVKVSIGDNFYKPKNVTIRRAQSIRWKNDGAVAHTVTSDSASDVKFDSGKLDPRGVYALKPSSPGDLTYYCTIHGKAQSGVVAVTR
jgi:plastocyanin